jgi:hypothetical protein
MVNAVTGMLNSQTGIYKRDVLAYTEKLRDEESNLYGTRKASNGKTALIFSMQNLSFSMRLESIFAKKLMHDYGYDVVIVTNTQCSFLSDQIHKKVYGFDKRVFLEDFVSLSRSKAADECVRRCLEAVDFNEIEAITYKNTRVGLHALATAANYTLTGDAVFSKKMIRKIAKLIKYSCMIADAAERIVQRHSPTVVLSIEKGFSGTCEMFYESIHRGIDFVQISSSFEPNKITLKRFTPENFRMHPNSVSLRSFQATQYSEEFSHLVINTLNKNYKTGNIYIYKNEKLDSKPILPKDEMIKRLSLDPKKKTAVIFSHVLNDANFFYGKDLFDGGFKEWLVRTIEAAGTNNRVNWILKLHPANAFKREWYGYSGEYAEILAIIEHLGEIPPNVTIIKPEAYDINPFSFFNVADYGITVRGTIGIELPSLGKPVITGGTGRYSGMGFTNESTDKGEYLEKIRKIEEIAPLTDEQKRSAVKYAYILFRLRPADCSTFFREFYPHKLPHPLFRDFEIIDRNYWNNPSLNNIVGFIANSRDEDYLSDRDYTV